jgi:nicotinamidase-related amidase
MESHNENTALLVMDMQMSIVGRLADPGLLLGNTAKAIAHARDKKIPVIYVVVGFRPGAPEISLNNKGFAAYKQTMAGANMDDMIKIHAAVAPRSGEITVVKRRISAFTGSDLEVVLRAYGIGRLVLTGIATSGVVLSTIREAADKDYSLTVIADCCADMDEEVHRVLTTKVFPRQADVLSVEEWCKI